MSKFLIHIHSGPDLKNKATLGMLVAVSAFNKGNEVNIFLAADGVHLLNTKKEGEVVGQGKGDLKNHLDSLIEKILNYMFQVCQQRHEVMMRVCWMVSMLNLLCLINF